MQRLMRSKEGVSGDNAIGDNRPRAAISPRPHDEYEFLEDFYEIAALIEYGISFFSKRIVFALHYHFSRHVAPRNRVNYGMRGIRESCLRT